MSAPVLAFVGVAGGVGTTTLAIAAARAAPGRLALSEAESCGGGLVAHGCEPSSPGLVSVAGAVPTGGSGLHVLADPPRALRNVRAARTRAALAETVAELRRTHDAVVLDCGTVRAFDADIMLALATHVVWVVAADAAAARRAELLLASDAAPDLTARPRATAAVAVSRRKPLPGRIPALRRFARGHSTRLVLVPHSRGEDALAPSLTALLGFADIPLVQSTTSEERSTHARTPRRRTPAA